MIVEFVGLPGAGKSYLARRLVETLQAQGMDASLPTAAVDETVSAPQRLARKTLLAVREALARPRLTSRAIRDVRAGVRTARKDSIGRSLQWLMTSRLLADARRRDGIHIFEEGLLQAMWSVGIRGDVTPMIDSAGSTRPDLVVVVDAPPALVSGRLNARSSRHSRLQRLEGRAAEDELTRGAELLQRILDWWGSSPMIRVTNGDEAEEAEALETMAARIWALSAER